MADGSLMEETVMKAYSMDLRVRAVADVDDGMTASAVAKKYSVSADWVRKLLRFRRAAVSDGERHRQQLAETLSRAG
jgi:transposase-like protein